MKKFFKSKVAATLLVLCVLLGTALPAWGAVSDGNRHWSISMTDTKNYTLCNGIKRTTLDYILFANTAAPTITLWGAFYSSGYVVTESRTLTKGQIKQRAYFKTPLINEPDPEDRLKARGELYKNSGTRTSTGACNFE